MADERAFGFGLATTHGQELTRGDVQAIIEARFSPFAAQELALAAYDRTMANLNPQESPQ